MTEHETFAKLITDLTSAAENARKIQAFRPDQAGWNLIAQNIDKAKEIIYDLASRGARQ